ncbi:Cyclin-T [Eumeta japonica]|uniref:Cyclin-T n=1 Tax=Eumeta variegata TaxID=151549 RepID=A0A4C1Z6Q2_EUMVA|nr:Cyclin-T [Eumeta japonica]
MHRFYAFHSFTQFHRNTIAALFPRRQDTRSEHYQEQVSRSIGLQEPEFICNHIEHAQDLVFNENVLLQTLGFDVADRPFAPAHVVAYAVTLSSAEGPSHFMASNSLHLTTMPKDRPTVVARLIHLASKWSNWAIPQSNEGKHWFFYVDHDCHSGALERLTAEFLHIFDKCPPG